MDASPFKQSRVWQWLAIIAVLAMIVAACGGPGATQRPGATGPAGTPSGPGGTPTGPGGTPTGPAGSPTGPAQTFEQLGGSVSVLATWTGTEQGFFMDMIQPWVEATGVQVSYQGSRDLGTILGPNIGGGGAGLPDVAGVPGLGEMEDWFALGALKPLSFINIDEYQASSALAELGIVDGQLAGVFIKSSPKGFIWYNVNNYDGTVPATWDELAAMDPAEGGSLWCNAFESGGDSGWPGTDWIEDFVIRESGPDVYDSWVAGQTKWTSPEIRAAFEKMADVIGKSHGGGTYINATTFNAVGDQLFADPPGCKFVHQASFIGAEGFQAVSGASPEDYDFFVMPDINPDFSGALVGGGDLFGMFNDTPQARSLIAYLITPEAQARWAASGGFIAANKNVPSSAYKDESDRKAGEAVANATAFRFDGGDAMPGEMKAAFFDAMVKLASNPDDIDTILTELDTIQEQAYSGTASPSP